MTLSEANNLNTPMHELLIIPVCRAMVLASEPGQLILMRRFLEGLGAYAERWPGKVTVFLRQTTELSTGLDPVVFNRNEHAFNVELLPQQGILLERRLASATLVLGTLASENLEIGRLVHSLGIPLVWITETSMRTRSQMVDAEANGHLRRLKRKACNWFQEFHYRKAIIEAAGVQCNGTPVYQAYKDLNRNSLLFFDSRVSENLLSSDAEIAIKAEYISQGLPLRMAFSGRLTEIKGVEHLPRVALKLKSLSIPFTLDIYGDGNMKSRLESDIRRLGLSSQVRVRGVLDFQAELIPIFRHSVDLFLCCHPQGDPSCTYLETLACGVPIVGYANEAWMGMHALTQAGWLIEMGDIELIAKTVANIHHNRSVWLAAALAARRFALSHTFEKTANERIQHLKQCANITL
jgi:colanic acid/amylovoran biosynthesis glycosyltransferase